MRGVSSASPRNRRRTDADAPRGPRQARRLLRLGFALLLALGLPAAALAFSFVTQAVLLPRPEPGMLLAGKELKLLSHRKIVEADIRLGKHRVRTLCLQGWTHLRGRKFGVPNQVLVTSAGWQAAHAQTAPRWHRLNSRQILSARRTVIAQLAGCAHMIVLHLAREVNGKQLQVRVVREPGTVQHVYRFSLGELHGTRYFLDARMHDLKPLAIIASGEYGDGIARIRVGPKPKSAVLRRKELALIRAGREPRRR
jgi:hypothetical protein